MSDREDTIFSLELNIRWIEENTAHQFPGWENTTTAMRNAVELLKADACKFDTPTTEVVGFLLRRSRRFRRTEHDLHDLHKR